MRKKINKNDEFDHFKELSNEWWDQKGKFKVLHQITPIRIEYIKNQIIANNQSSKKYNKILNGLDILDLGCGGGLICEPLTRLGANVTGIDFIKENIKTAKNHAKISNLKINYMSKDINFIKLNKKYDIILMLEIIEHLENWETIVSKILNFLKPKGKIIFSTINRTLHARIFAIFLAEEILRIIPKETHHYNKLIKPTELHNFLKKNNMNIIDTTGLVFNPLNNEWYLNKKRIRINYFCTAKKIN